MQHAFCEQAQKFVADRLGDDADTQTVDVLSRWQAINDQLGHDPMMLADQLDWVAKLKLLEGYRDREGLGWSSAKLALVDLQYSDVRQDKGLYNRLVARGSMQTLLSRAEVEAAVTAPPTDTRAYFRGRALSQFGRSVAAASWDSVIFDVGRDSLQRVPMLEPTRGTEAHVGELFDRCETAAELVAAITGH